MSEATYNPPLKPQVPKMLCPVTAAYKLEPYVLAVEDPDRFTAEGVDYKEDFVVAVGKLRASDFSVFEEMYKMTLKSAILNASAATAILGFDTEEAIAFGKETGLWYDPEKNEYHVGRAIVPKHPETFLLEVIAFCLSRFGRIVGQAGKGYDLEDVDIDEILSILDPDLASLQNDEGQSMFFDLMSTLGVLRWDTVETPAEGEGVDPLPETAEVQPKPKRASREKNDDAEKTKKN